VRGASRARLIQLAMLCATLCLFAVTASAVVIEEFGRLEALGVGLLSLRPVPEPETAAILALGLLGLALGLLGLAVLGRPARRPR